MQLRRIVISAAVAALVAVAVPAAVAERVVTLDGAPTSAPDRLDKVRVLQVGPAKADRVLVLLPGTSAGAAYFKPLADDLVDRLPGWQVWAVERRENLLEDHSALDRAKAGDLAPPALLDYYLGWIGADATASPRFVAPTTEETAFAREWGMAVAIGDVRRVVRAARRGGRRVTLGGHSLGATMAVAYATWDFEGRAGARGLDGLVLVDGGSSRGEPPTPARARTALAELATASPFLDLTGLGLPWSAGVFNAVGSTAALLAPDEPSVLGSWPLLPANLRPPVPATNLAGYGYALDVETGPATLALVQAHIGRLAGDGDPRGWVDDGLTTARRAATVFSGIPGMDGTAWYHPRRLSIDAGAVNGGIANPAQRALGVRAVHGRDLRLALYAFETSLGAGRVLDAARDLARRSRLPARRVTLVDRGATTAHMDPIAALPGRNDLLGTLVEFLRGLR